MQNKKTLSVDSPANSRSFLKRYLQLFIATGILLLLVIFFGIFGKNFLTPATGLNILESSYYIGFLAIGVTFVIITSGIDLSLGTVMMTAAIVGGVAFSNWHLPLAVGLLLAVLTGVLFGVLNGWLISYIGLPPFIATLGTQMIASGVGAIVSQVQTVRFPGIGSDNEWFKHLFLKTQNNFPMGLVWLGAFFVIAYIILNHTRMGRYTFAIGSNEEAARLSGVDTKKWKLVVYIINGLYVGLAAVMYAVTYTSIVPLSGAGMETQAIAAVVIGGTSLSGGVGSLLGTIVGVYIMAVLKPGLMSMNLQSQYQVLATGIVVILAVMLDVFNAKISQKA